MRISVIGGSGTLGKLAVAELQRRGHDVTAASRRTGVDVVTGAGVADVVRDRDAVLDCVNVQTASAGRAITFFTTAARTTAKAVLDAGTPHLVSLSIIGVEHPALQRGNGYYRGKAAQETELLASGAPLTLVKTTQWFELAQAFLLGRIGRVSVVPHMRSRPVAGSAVAELLADTVEAGPRAGGPSASRPHRLLAGPEERDLADLARAIGATRTPRQRVLAFRIPGAGRVFAAGGLLPDSGVPAAGPRFEEWLAAAPR